MNELLNNQDYKNWLIELKSNIQQSQIKAALAVNSQLIQLYWDLGKQITEKQETAKWGSGFIDQLSKDLRAEFPEMKGFSVDNLAYFKVFYRFYKDHLISEQVVRKLENPITNQAISQSEKVEQVAPKLNNEIFVIPWGHHLVILKKIKNQPEAIFYIKETIKNNWSRAVLVHQIESNLYERLRKSRLKFSKYLAQTTIGFSQSTAQRPV